MSDAARYRQKAREFEQRENWRRAIEAYELAIEADERAYREVDPAIYNRVGDLYRRVGDVNKAVEYYEMAVDGHLAAGFYNNAIALCNKILRNQPNRQSAYFKLGKIAAAKGFLSDARKHFLEYAERMREAGQLDEAFSALVEFANLSPDPEVRLMIADQLIEHERVSMAVEQLRLAWRDLVDEGRDADAEEVRERILEMAPERDPVIDPPEEATAMELDAEGVIDLPEILPYDEPQVRPAARTEEEVAETPAAEGEPERAGEEDVEAVDAAAAELEAEEESEGPLGLIPTGLDEGSGTGTEPPPGEERLEIVPTALGLVKGGEEAAPEPGLVEERAEVELTPADRVAQLEARLEIQGRDPGLLVELANVLLETGERDRATALLQEALVLHEQREEFREAGRVVDELLRLDVNNLRAYQKRVELALKAQDRGALIEAYLGLADCLDRTDASNKSRAIYERVLELDPQNERAASVLDMIGEEKAETSAAPAADGGGGDYVDLAALVIGEEAGEKSTRFRIPASDPRSEADVNFAEMLDQFKSKVAETIDKEDASSHYDLGLAFKDMGLVDEAIAEFQIAARAPSFRLRAIEMLGACFLEKGEQRIAVKVLGRALQVPGHTDEDLVGIYYALGRAYESLGEAGMALEWYERVLGCDVGFKDVSERVAALRG